MGLNTYEKGVVRAMTDAEKRAIVEALGVPYWNGTSWVSSDGNRLLSAAKAKPSSVLAKWPYGNVATAVASASNFTYHTTMTVEYAATRFRVAFLNLNTTTCVVGPAIIAVSNAVGADPTIGSTTSQARFTPSTGVWVPLTFGGGNATATLPARISATQPSITWSDWIDISTIPRTDGGTLPVVMIRYYIPSNSTTNAYNIGGNQQQHGLAFANKANTGALATTWTDGRLHQSIRFSGDGITTPATFAPTTDLGYCMVMGLEYASKRPGFTILADGDSIPAGAVDGLNGNFGNGWVWQMVRLLRAALPNTPIEVANIGVPSSATSTFLARLNAYVAAGGHYDLAYYSPFSPNDGTPSTTLSDAQFALFAQAMDVINAAGKPLFISTPCPNTAAAWNTAADAARLAMRTELLNAGYAGTTVIDFEALSDGATPARFAAAYTTDGTHPNEAGHAVLAALAKAGVLPYLA